MRTRSALLAALVLPLALAITSEVAGAQANEAETHFKRGVSLYQESDFKAALAEFRRAYELSHNWRLLYNVGQAEYQAHDYAAALSSFETFLHDGGDRIPKARRSDVEQEIARLRLRVGKLTIRASVAGAIVVIDDEPVGTTPLTRNVAVGGRRILVKKDGYQPWSKNVEVASGDDLLFDAALDPSSSAPTTSPGAANDAPTPAPGTPHRFPWEPWTVTGVLGVAALTTGILSLTAASRLSRDKGRFDVTDSELADDSTHVKTFALTTDILVLATLAAAGASLYFTLTPTAPFSASLRFTPTASGGVVSGRF